MLWKALRERWRGGGWLVLAGGALWLLLIRQLRGEWTLNEQYHYGWFVPLLALYLGWEAWQCRPVLQRPGSRRGIIFCLGLLLLFLFPIRLVQESNPDWRLVSWLFALVTVGGTWCGLYLGGGIAGWRHFAFASAFILTAVPWPSPIEQPLVQGLMEYVAAAGVEILTWIGIPAQANGNVIALPGQLVGVDEACSGVRSLQTVIMAGLFLGEIQRMSWRRRVALLIFGVGLALAMNVARTVILVWIVASEGAAKLELWHDKVGMAVLIGTLVGVWGIALGLSRGVAMSAPTVTTRNDSTRLFPTGAAQRWAFVLLGWLLIIELATEGWYRWHERSAVETTPWTVSFAAGSPMKDWTVTPIQLRERERRLLRADEVEASLWRHSFDTEVTAYYLRWYPGLNAAQLARLHRPEVCLPSAGCFLRANEGAWKTEVGPVSLVFRRLIFDDRGHPLFVFYCLAEDYVSSEINPGEDWSGWSRLLATVHGRRHLGQRALELIVSGSKDLAQAERLAAAVVNASVRPLKDRRDAGRSD